MQRSIIDPSLYLTLLGEVQPYGKGYIWGLEVEGNEASVKAFEAWCLECLKTGFRTAKRKKSVSRFGRNALTGDRIEYDPPYVDITTQINFKDKGKLALVRLQWM
jgi:hypothetical protein